MSVPKPKKMVSRSVAVALGIICIVLVAGPVGALAYYVNDKNNTISSLNSQISQLNSNVTNLQNQVASDNATINYLTSEVTNLTNILHALSLQNSSTYFAISDLAATCYVVGNSSAFNDTYLGTVVLINDFGFNFTPINGPATNVTIFTSGSARADWEGIVIPNGTSTFSGELMPIFPMPSYRQSDGTYTLRVRIGCVEADGYITLNFTADNLVSLGPQPT